MACHHSLAARLIAAALVICAAFAYAAAAQDPGIKEYQRLLNAGDLAKAASAGAGILSAIKADPSRAAAAASVEARIASITDIRSLTASKLDLLRHGVEGGSASPFRYVSPTPSELYGLALQRIRNSPLTMAGLSADQASFAKSYSETVTLLADSAMVEAYERIIGAKADPDSAAKARAYLTAYILGAHEDAALPAVLSLLSRRVTPPALPAFLVDDAVGAIGDARVAFQTLKALEAVPGASFPQLEKARLLKATADLAEKEREYGIALVAWNKLSVEGDAAPAQEAQCAVIRILAEKSNDYAGAVHACDEYLMRFPDGAERVNVEYLKGRYECEAKHFDAATVDLKSFLDRHADSDLVPSALVYEGIALTGQGKTDDAIRTFGDFIAKYPKHRLADKAQLLEGIAYMQAHRYTEAIDAFQRVIDFYPDSPSANQAVECKQSVQGIVTAGQKGR